MQTTGDRMDETMGHREEANNDVIERRNNDDGDDKRTSEAKISTEQSQYDNPVDQGWAWVVLIGCFGISMFIIGGLKSFGVLYVEMAKKFQVSNQALSSVQSLAGFFYLFFAPVCNALSTRFTHRLVIFVGGIMTCSGLILSSLAPSVVVLYFTYGVITGIGYSLCFSSSVVMVANYFVKYRSFATGLSLSGGGLGAMTIPYLIRYLMNEYGLEGALLIHAGVMSNICVCAMLLRPFTNYPLKRQPQQNTCVNEDHENESLINISEPHNEYQNSNTQNAATVIISKDTLDCESSDNMLPHDDNETQRSKYLHPEHHTGSRLHLSKDSINVIAASISCQSLPRIFEASSNSQVSDKSAQKESFLREIKWKLFRNPVFIVFFVVIFFSMVSYHSLFNIVPPFADEIGLSGEDGALVLLVFGATDLIGRIGFGLLMDIFSTTKQRHIIFTTCVSVCAVGVILTPMFRSLLTLSLFMASYGCFAGGYNANAMIVVVDKVGLKVLPSAWGFICLSASIAMLINPWASGLIKDSTGTWSHAFRFTGSMSLMAVILLLLMPYIEKWHSRRQGTRVS
ncbi:monocarboxylate transporter 5-like [Pecten maximus]|uniref:monocarboxylate transporter 5-like n=1 Tax=Pecten maximus TaxID=6579 RepID=UPI0014584553|nr:monocarboxylate transporter 5-like [Pecten maximus]